MSKDLFILKIFLKDSPKTDNKYNKLILEFLNNNLEEISSYGCYIRLILLNNTNIDKFLKMKIKNIPALYDETSNTSITGVEDIIKYIIYKCSPASEEPVENKQPPRESLQNKKLEKGEDDPLSLRGYLMNEVLKDDGFEDTIDMEKVKMREDLYKKKKELLQPTNSSANKHNITTAKSNVNNQAYNSSIENRTDPLDAMRESNNEITKTKKISSLVKDEDDAVRSYWDNLEETE